MSPLRGRIRNTSLVREPDPRHRRFLLVALGLVLGFALPALWYVLQQNRAVSLRYRVTDLREEVETARERNRVLAARLEQLASPAALKERVEKLGLDLVPAEEGRVEMIASAPVEAARASATPEETPRRPRGSAEERGEGTR